MVNKTFKACLYLNCLFLKHSSRKHLGNLSSLHSIHSGIKRENFVKFTRKLTEKSDVVLSHRTLIDLLKNCKSVSEQIEVFQSYLKLSDEDSAKRISLCKNIENIFKSEFPNCAVHLVGSSVSGLGLKSSDVDFSFQFSATDSSQNKAASTNIISSVDVARGRISMSNLPSLTVKQQLLVLQRILKQHKVAVTSTIVPGHHPILNFKFNDLGCDLSINNWSAFQSTKLMKFCVELDHRILPLFQLLSYWGKKSKLIGGPMKFKSYSLFLMVVYFLQSRSSPVLPSIQEILNKSELLKNPNNWSYDTTQHVEKLSPSNNTSKLETLLREFFFFYSNFDFSMVICTLNTELIDAKSYISKYPEFELNTISIQDPLDCSQNVTTGINWRYSKKFIKSLLSTCEIYHKFSQSFTADENWGLAATLDVPFRDYSFESDRTLEIEIPLNKFENCDTCYFKTASEKVYNILRNGLLFQCNPFEHDTVFSESSKADDTIDKLQCIKNGNREILFKDEATTQTSEKILISRNLYTTSNTWSGRSNYSQNVHSEEKNFIDCECEISKKILENKKEKETEAYQFLCESYRTYKDNNPQLYMNIVSFKEEALLLKLRIFLKEYILNYSRIYL